MDFETFYKCYPRKVAKKKVVVAWNKLSTEEQEKCIEVIGKHVALWKSEGRDMKYIPYPASWLNAGSFDDELPEPKVNGKAWHETSTGIEEKGRELGILPDQFEHWQWFRTAVMKAAA